MYKKLTNKELTELLLIHERLTFQAQLELFKEFKKRGLEETASDLRATIDKTQTEIENLEHLKDLGFSAEKVSDSLIVNRSFGAVVLDITAILLGLCFIFIGVFGFIRLYGMFVSEDPFSFMGLLLNFGLMALGFLGVKFLNGIKRLWDYSGFQLSSSNGNIIMKKRFDLKLEERQQKLDNLYLEAYPDQLKLMLDKDEILSGNAENLIQNKTLKELKEKLKES